MNFKQRGVTFVELVTSVAVVAIMMGLSAPSYSGFISKRKVAGASNMVSVFFENIKMESIKRSEFVTISFKSEDDGNSWCIGAASGKDAPCDCMDAPAQCTIDSQPALLSSQTFQDFSEIQASFVDGSVTFDPVRGILADPSDSVSIDVKHVNHDYSVNVTVNATGSVRKCTPSDHKLVGYVTCS
ncbi:MAG: hypothetical protein HKO64_00665 [Xanthomonadales bacterium]|nr:hypothetical protein [Gammaproteobacteria bacterium]NNE04352.1 hypothetical protein [Xanthomonadales bacterium]NNL94108.1 hypothetical protein [Xanthomonadales bacterium]